MRGASRFESSGSSSKSSWDVIYVRNVVGVHIIELHRELGKLQAKTWQENRGLQKGRMEDGTIFRNGATTRFIGGGGKFEKRKEEKKNLNRLDKKKKARTKLGIH
jgi:hypothetical protein